MKPFFYTLLFAITLMGCTNNEEQSITFTPINITPILIGQGNDVLGLPNNNLRITNQTDWNLLLNEMSTVSSNFTETTIDFINFDIIAIIDIDRPCTNFFVNIDSVVENENDITIDYTVTGQTDNCYTGMVQPYHIVKIPKSPKPVIFQ